MHILHTQHPRFCQNKKQVYNYLAERDDRPTATHVWQQDTKRSPIAKFSHPWRECQFRSNLVRYILNISGAATTSMANRCLCYSLWLLLQSLSTSTQYHSRLANSDRNLRPVQRNEGSKHIYCRTWWYSTLSSYTSNHIPNYSALPGLPLSNRPHSQTSCCNLNLIYVIGFRQKVSFSSPWFSLFFLFFVVYISFTLVPESRGWPGNKEKRFNKEQPSYHDVTKQEQSKSSPTTLPPRPTTPPSTSTFKPCYDSTTRTDPSLTSREVRTMSLSKKIEQDY